MLQNPHDDLLIHVGLGLLTVLTVHVRGLLVIHTVLL